MMEMRLLYFHLFLEASSRLIDKDEGFWGKVRGIDMRFGPIEIMILLAIFFLLFGAERLPKLARAAGQSKGEFQKGLSEVTGQPSTANTEADLEAGGKTKSVELAQKAEEAGVDPSGKTADEINEEIESKEK